MRLKIFFNFKRIFFFFLLLLLVLTFWTPSKVYCQSAGLKYVKSYNRKDYGRRSQNQNWSILQDRRGIIYVGNQGCLLEFDGVSWQPIDVPNRSVRSLAIDDAGTVYIGGQDEIGFLAPDSQGALQYISLLDHINENKRNFSTVWSTHATKEGIYFRTSKFLFRWNHREIKVWESKHSFKAAFYWNGKFLVQQKKVGLQQIVNDSLQLLPGGENFSEHKIFVMVPYGDHKLLIGDRSRGLCIYDNGAIMPFRTEADDYLKENQLYQGIRLSTGDFALATLRGGLVIIDSLGHLKYIYNKASGVQNDNVKYVFEDSQGNLWLALEKGISKIEYASPFSIYDDRSGLPGLVLSVVRHRNGLYVGTTRGLYSLVSPSTNKFVPVPGMSDNCWSLLSVGDFVLAAASTGVFQVENKNNNFIKRRIIEGYSFALFQSISVQNRIWVGTRRGLISLYSENGRCMVEHKFDNILQSIQTIVEDKKGNLWLGTLTKGVLKVDFPSDGTISNPGVTRYDISHGLPAGEINLFMAAGHVMFASSAKGVFRFDEVNKRFISDSTLGYEFTDGSRGVFRIAEDKNKNIWFHSSNENFQAITGADGAFVQNSKPILQIPDVPVNSIYPDPDADTIWFATHDGLIRFDTTGKENSRNKVSTLIRKVLISGKLFFDGYKNNSELPFPIIDYADRNLHFEFAAPFLHDESEIRYQYFLEGYDEDWSAWNKETQKDYTNLDSGLYTFRVRAMNVYENLSREAVFQFKVLLPWYRTWWAFLSYALVFFLMTYLIVKWWRSRKLEVEKQRLEQIVKERTKEIEEKNQQLQEMAAVKSRFFANISHEFRTPLTLIMGPLEQMLSDCREKENKEKLDLMLRNSQRLLGLINQLLELSKFESGKVKLQASRQNIIPFLKGLTASFEPLAIQKQLNLTFHAEEEDISLYIDLGKIEEVLCNLLSNAVKFTPPGGKITVTAARNSPEEAHFPLGSLDIWVRDTGAGIPREQLDNIFDRFYQSDSTYEYHWKGSGIGLAIAKELVELHHGKIDVHSRVGKNSGTDFVIRLPMGDAHLEPDEMVDLSENPAGGKSPDEIQALYMMEKPGVPADDQEVDAAVTNKDIEPGAHEKDIILVVEDSADVRHYIRGSLEPVYMVVDARDGREGIQKAQEIIPDLIISDIMMPEADGYELCRVLKSDITTCHIPIVLLTAKASEESIVEGLETGADDYITKPFNTKILCARIKNLIDLRRQLQQKVQRKMTLQPVKMSMSKMDEEFLEELETVIEKNLPDPEFNVEGLCKKLYMSRATLYRKIHALTGEAPNEFIRSYRLKRGAELLKHNFGTVLEVAFEVGFSSANYFSKCFKRKFHQLPSTFQTSESS